MRKLKLQVQMSIDGFIAGTNGEMDWLTWNWDDQIKSYVMGITAPVDTIILGRKLAEGFIPAWESSLANPDTADEFARKMVETHKVVFTKTLEGSTWSNTVLAKGDLVEEVNSLKNQSRGDIIAYGGGTFVSNLIANCLVDEFHLFINPTAIGSGMTIFKDLHQKQSLKLAESRSFECGIVVLKYLLP